MTRERHKFTLTRRSGREHKGWVEANRNEPRVFVALYPVRGTLPLAEARALADALHDACDDIEQREGAL